MKEHPKHPEYLISEDGIIIKKGKKKPITQREDKGGYVLVSFCTGNGVSLTKRVHRIVAETYIDNPENKPEVNHKDGNKKNNHYTNLEWCTSQENKDHAWEMGLYDNNVGERHHSSNLTEDLVNQVCQLFQEGWRNKDISEELGISKDHIASIRTGRIWKSVSCKYSFSKKRVERKSLNTILAICHKLEDGLSNEEIGKMFKMNPKEIQRIRRKEVHSEISSNFNFPRSSFSKLTEEEVRFICEQISKGFSTKELVAMGVANSTMINRIKSKKVHSAISNLYF